LKAVAGHAPTPHLHGIEVGGYNDTDWRLSFLRKYPVCIVTTSELW